MLKSKAALLFQPQAPRQIRLSARRLQGASPALPVGRFETTGGEQAVKTFSTACYMAGKIPDDSATAYGRGRRQAQNEPPLSASICVEPRLAAAGRDSITRSFRQFSEQNSIVVGLFAQLTLSDEAINTIK